MTKHQKRIPDLLLDRIDIHIEAPSVDYEKFISSYGISKISLSIRKRIKGALVHGYFVQEHRQKRWLWISMCRRTCQIIAYAIGDRSQKTCQLL